MSGIRTRAIEIVSVFEMEFRSEKDMRYLIVKFMVHKRMPEKFCFVDLIRNFMVFIEPEAQPY